MCRFSEGSHRIRSSWAEARYEWLDEQGKPKPLEWQRCGATVKALEDMDFATAHGEPLCKVSFGELEG